ncbi:MULTISPECIES: FecCD family ABC transporter permease [Bacillus]|uniref:FecCD family ABC transporter permease n=1 Tax=Bacillus TaxID=1386 RepID=UPI0002885614|nr:MULTISPECIES: iron ABC transporter permease [Bacillus]MBG9769957.1 ferrichrome ABC transporter permease [Bacillus vallismortis]MCY8423338.1 iron ABC transporter permease [Bacillus vallismortis]MEC1270196.1 iron ABC transporter permease [Bacillus vallismortis]PJZ01696.1 iron ABC transporter permease [Bacillus vallismortis]QAV10244.1 iron ABC transporter permease [Bacillus vallismortis]
MYSKQWTRIILITSPFAIALSLLLSILYGAKHLNTDIVFTSLIHFDPGNTDHQIIWHSRIPRAAGALLIGAALAVSGALMQGITRNYLASPSIMGVSDGSAFIITLCMVLLPQSSSFEMIIYSFIGSALGAVLVFSLAAMMPNGFSPVQLAIIGTVTSMLLSSLSAAMSIYFQISQDLSFWYSARLHQMSPDFLKLAAPFFLIGIVIAVSLSKKVTAVSLGEDISKSLGQKKKTIKIMAMLSVIILTGSAVALAGKIAFVGLVVPHITRFLVGSDYSRLIPCSCILGGVFLTLCDLASRFINYPFETPIEVVTSIIGVPFFLYLIKRKGGEQNG